MAGGMVLYRGSLKSCNYQCSYCPFSKHPPSVRELEQDREQWLSFVGELAQCGQTLGIGALLVVPYGEALLHSWYWDGLAQISRLPEIDAVGAQTNLSFPVRQSMKNFVRVGGVAEKLRIWATFHPEMTTVSAFAEKCRQLREEGVALSAGAVGVPDNIALLCELREKLPSEIYLWFNKMDGLKRAYTPGEKKAFAEIDPCFSRELKVFPADVAQCHKRLFVEGGGRLRLCNISRLLDGSWQELCEEKQTQPAAVSVDREPERKEKNVSFFRCGRKRCSCFLAYGGRDNLVNRMLFGPYPLFRIPRRPKAVFLDIMGTLIAPVKEDGVHNVSAEEEILEALRILFQENTVLFFATTLPYKEAVSRCHTIRHLFSGGVFAAGAHIVLQQDGRTKEQFYYLDDLLATALSALQRKFSFRLLTSKNSGRLYKITLFRAGRRPWSVREGEELFCALPGPLRSGVRYFAEDNCLQIVSAQADKAAGVRTICAWLGILPCETFAAGDSQEDAEMTELCGN